MQRYFIEDHQLKPNMITIVGDDVHHIRRVMRYQEGTPLICVDGKGHDYLVEIAKITDAAVHCKIIKVMPSKGETKLQIALAQALPKGDKWEWILQKGTELGVAQFYPFLSERTVVKIHSEKVDKKLSRWQRIVKEAAEQAERGIIPKVHHPVKWDSLLSIIQQWENVWIAYERGGKPFRSCLEQQKEDQQALLIVGPEGGFSPNEIEEAVQAGAEPVTLGPRILRTETAAVVGLSCILYANGELGG